MILYLELDALIYFVRSVLLESATHFDVAAADPRRAVVLQMISRGRETVNEIVNIS